MTLSDFLNGATTPMETARLAAKMLEEAGFRPSDGSDGPGRHYQIHGERTLFAWIAPAGTPRTAQIVSGHTDFPALRVKAKPFIVQNGALFLALHPYDGPNLATWIDRDLGVAGQVFMAGVNGVEAHRIAPDLTLRTLGLPPHMRAEAGPPNAQTDMHALIGRAESLDPGAAWAQLLEGTGIEGVPLSHDLWLHDRAPAATFGAGDAFLSAPRLDNLVSAHAAIAALAAQDAPADHVPLVALFDAEEIGSRTWLGAGGPLLERLLARIAGDALGDMLSASAHVSLDVAQAVHPVQPGLWDDAASPRIGAGPALKSGIRGNYTEDARLTAHVTVLAERCGDALQTFTYRADRGQGGSLGPHLATRLGIRSIDMGVPIFAMHSIREACALGDIDASRRIVSAFLADPLAPGA